MITSPAIQYIPPNRNADGRIVGIDVAVRTLLDAFCRYSRSETFYCRTDSPDIFEEFRARMREIGADPARCAYLPTDDIDALDEVSVLFRPDPNINKLVAERSLAKETPYAVCGLSHTMSSLQVMGTVAVAIAQPMQSWDAIVCPSRAIRSVVEALWTAAGQGAPLTPAQLPIIPLGIDTERFRRAATSAKRADQRERLGVSQEDILLLFHGRLSYHNKAHPLPIFLAAERIAERHRAEGKSGEIHLVFYGFFTADTFREDYLRAAHDICRSAKIHFVENTDPRFPDALWAGADIFASLADNIQESFGLTPIEAMACGLPAVVSDWDGYRDTVRDGKDGFLIPTLAPPPGAGQELVRRYLAGEDVYGEYLAGASQSIAVDIDATAEALWRLIANPELRRTFGAAGRKRAREIFDWSVIIPAYEDLWSELDRRRRKDAPLPPVVEHAITGPRELDPFLVFQGFPTAVLSPDDRITLADNAAHVLAQRLRHRMNMFVPAHLLEAEALPRLLVAIRRSRWVGEITARWPEAERARLLLTLVWLVKMGVALRHADPSSGRPPAGTQSKTLT